MTEMEVEHLSWIYSNKFTTVELFHKKFMSGQSSRNAYYILNGYANPQNDFLQIEKTSANNKSIFFLTPKTIKTLDAVNKILVRNPRLGVRVNQNEKIHDLSVQAIRVAFESNKDIGNVYWVSDFEMRAGITHPIKRAFENGELDVERWRGNWINIHFRGRRTPDGYFEADLDGQRFSFVLEFEHNPYSDKSFNRMIGYLDESYPEALRLVVSANSKNAVRMIKNLQSRIPEGTKKRWFVSDFEKATTRPFKSIWHQLDHPLSG